MGIIPFDLTIDSQMSKFNEFEEEFVKKYKCPKCGNVNKPKNEN